MSTRKIRRWLLIVNNVVVIASTGCQTMTNRMAKVPPPQATASEQSTPTGMAKTDFHREISRDQQFNVHVELAKVHESQGNNDAALAEYEQAIAIGERRGSILASGKLGPEAMSLAHRRMAATYDRMGRFALAETHYNQALKLTPNDPKVWNDAGYSYYLQNRLADAERTLKTAKTFAPTDARILTNLGLTLAVAGKTDEALSTLSQAGGPAVGHANLGYILAATGRTEEARKQYESALAMQPELSSARQALSKLDIQPSATAIARRDEPNRPFDKSAERLDPNVAATSIPNAVNSAVAPSAAQGSAMVNPVVPPAAEPGSPASMAPNGPLPASADVIPQEPTPAPGMAPTSAGPTQEPAQSVTSEASARESATSWIEPVKSSQASATQPLSDRANQALEPVTNPVVSGSDYAPPPSQPAAEPNETAENAIPLTVVGENEAAVASAPVPATPRAESASRAVTTAEGVPQTIASRPSNDMINDGQVPAPAPVPEPSPDPAAAPSQEAAPPSAATPAPAAETAPVPTPEATSASSPAMNAAPNITAPTQAAPAATETATEAEATDPADLRNPFPAGMNELLTKPEAGSGTMTANPSQGTYPSKTAPAQAGAPSVSPAAISPSPQSAAASLPDPAKTAPAQAVAPRVSPATANASPQSVADSHPDPLPTSNLPSPYGTGSLDPASKSLPPSANPNRSRPYAAGGMNSQDPAIAGNPAPSKNLPSEFVAGAARPYRAQPAPPSKTSPAGTVPGWVVPKNYRPATYPPTPSDLATRAPRKTTPSNTIPPTPW